MEFYAHQMQGLQQLGDVAALPAPFGGKQQQRCKDPLVGRAGK